MDTSNLITIQGTMASVNVLNHTCEMLTTDGSMLRCTFPEVLTHRVIETLGDKIAALGEATMSPNNGHQPTISELKIQTIGVLENGPYSTDKRKPVTAQALIDLGFFELGENRDDLGDIPDYPNQLRKHTWSGGNE